MMNQLVLRLAVRAFVAFVCFHPVFADTTEKFDKKQEKPTYLSCPVLRDRTRDFLRYHYVYRNFNEELSKRTFSMYFKLLDPGKLYFTKNDLDSFASYETTLGENLDEVNCRFASEVYARYRARVQAMTGILSELLEKPFDFSKKEFIETDRKKIVWANNDEELRERWRKSLKFIALNMKDTLDGPAIVKRLKKRYQMFLKDVQSRSTDDIHALFLNAFALSLDPHSSFLTPVDNAQFQIDFSLKLVGIGASLMNIDGYTTIDSITPGGAAARDGTLKKGDKIVAVDSGDGNGWQDVIDMDLDKVVQMIRGKEGTRVRLTILRKPLHGEVKRLQVELVRAVVQIKESEAKSDVMMLGGRRVGIINLPSFYIDYRDCQDNFVSCRSSANDMAREIKKLKAQNVDGIVVDLRRNGGGDLTEVQKIVGLFIDDPIVTQIEERGSRVHSLDVDTQALYKGPLAILVSRYTASASEILAGAVQDYGRGIILGDSRTFGKGTVQTVIEIPGTGGRQTNGAIHVTVAKFFRPSGKSNQERGVLSDVVIPDILDATDTGEDESDYALPYTVIHQAKDFRPDNTLAPLVPKLQQLSTERVKRDTAFKEITEAIQKAKTDKSTLVSLSEDSRKVTKKNDAKAQKEEGSLSAPRFSFQVIRKNDIELKEAASILLDAIRLLKAPGEGASPDKSDWVRHATKSNDS